MTPIKWILLGAGIVGVVAVTLFLIAWARPGVVVTEAVEGQVVEAFYATGTLQPDREYPIRASSAGVLMRLPDELAGPAPTTAPAVLPTTAPTTRPIIDKGDRVTAGQPLALVADVQWQAAVDKARAELEEKLARANEESSPVLTELEAKISAMGDQLQIARREETRVTKLIESGGSSQAEFDAAINRVRGLVMDVETNKAQKQSMKLLVRKDLDVAEAALRAAIWNLDLQVLRSPIDGVVLDRPVPLGTRLAVNDHVMQVADVRPDKLVMRAQVDEEDVTRVTIGQTVRMVLYSFGQKPFEGRVTRIYDKADPDRRTFEVDVTPVASNPRFAAGMTGELAFEVTSKPRALYVPTQAVQDGKLYLIRAGRLKMIEAVVGVRGIERAEILAGLRPGDRILISPAGDMTDGQRVREQFMDPAAAAAINKPKNKEIFRGGF